MKITKKDEDKQDVNICRGKRMRGVRVRRGNGKIRRQRGDAQGQDHDDGQSKC